MKHNIRRAPEGGYIGQVSLGFNASGGRVRPTRRGKTRAEVAHKLDAAVREHFASDAEPGKKPQQERLTFGDWYGKWISEQNQSREVAQGTVDQYRSIASNHVLPVFGERQLTSLTGPEVLTFYEELRDQGRSGTLVKVAATIIRQTLNLALMHGLVPSNVAVSVRPPRTTKATSPEAFTDDEWDRIARVLANQPDRARWLFQICSGVRQSETLGFCFDSIDLRTGVVRVTRQLRRQRWIHGCRPLSDATPSCGRRAGSPPRPRRFVTRHRAERAGCRARRPHLRIIGEVRAQPVSDLLRAMPLFQPRDYFGHRRLPGSASTPNRLGRTSLAGVVLRDMLRPGRFKAARHGRVSSA